MAQFDNKIQYREGAFSKKPHILYALSVMDFCRDGLCILISLCTCIEIGNCADAI